MNTNEQLILGLAMVFPETLRDLDQIRPKHFAHPQSGAVWNLIQNMDTNGEYVSPESVAGNINRLPKLDRQGVNYAWLAECVSVAHTPAQAATAANQQINAANMRALRDAVTRSQQIIEAGSDATETLETVRALIDSAAPGGTQGTPLSESIPHSLNRFQEEAKFKPTPWPHLNELIDGWRPGALYVVGARPGEGKTIFGVQAALGLAQYGPVAFNTLEMDTHEVNQRIISHMGDVWISHLQGKRDGHTGITPYEEANITRITPTLMDLPLSVQDDQAATPLTVRAHARSLTRQGELAGIIIDYLQLMEPAERDSRPRHEIVSGYSRALKKLAKEMDAPVIALAQLNRGATGSPTLAHLRESGALEQDADVVILLNRPEETDGQGGSSFDERSLYINVAKNRHGPQGGFRVERTGGKSTIGPLLRAV